MLFNFIICLNAFLLGFYCGIVFINRKNNKLKLEIEELEDEINDFYN